MLKYILIVIALSVAVMALTSKRSNKQISAENRQQLQQSCVAKGSSSNVLSSALDNFCSCTADKTVAAFGVEGVSRLKSGKGLTAADMDRAKELAIACAQEFPLR
jgi:hypothetical protein